MLGVCTVSCDSGKVVASGLMSDAWDVGLRHACVRLDVLGVDDRYEWLVGWDCCAIRHQKQAHNHLQRWMK